MAYRTEFRGVFTPLVTPIDEAESPDLESLARLVEFQLESGVDGLWVMGTSGEFASFDEAERAGVIETVVAAVGGRVPVIANVSDAATRLAIRHARRAQAAGADGIAATPPYYYPHSQDELLVHFARIRDAVDLPLFIYNIPQTVRVRVELKTAQKLTLEGVLAGIKDSQNDLDWFRQLARFVRHRDLDFALFCGTRFLIDAAVVAGATGVIPSVANAFPDLCLAVYAAAVAGDATSATDAANRLMDAESPSEVLTLGSRNAAVLGILKAVLFERGVIKSPALTSPLRVMTLDEHRNVADVLASLAPSRVGQ
jgi:4-hydroxy-tetrahydrodipicolinate synthase